jgi:hypothetical protein
MTTIDDVDFMLEHSDKDSATFLIDSSSRARQYYPTPSEYMIEFTDPVRNAFGIDILDATIPGTMYNIDYHNCMMRYYTVKPSAGISAHDFKSAFQIMAYSPRFVAGMSDTNTQYRVHLVSSDELTRLLSQNASTIVVSANVTSTMVVAYDLVQAQLEVMSSADFSAFGLNGRTTYSNRVIEGSNILWFWSGGVWYGVRDAAIADTIRRFSENTDAYGVTVIPSGSTSAAVTHDVVLTHTIYVNTDYLGDNIVEWTVFMNTMRVELGNYNISSLASTMADAMLNFSVTSTSTGNLEKQNRYLFIQPTGPYILDMKNSSIREVLGFDMLPSVTDVANGSYSTMTVNDNDMLYVSIYQPVYRDWRVRAPGVVNLLGVRYVTLRCPEIEDHLHGSRSYGSHSTGVGVFKLPSPNEVAQLRFDFVSLIRKPFHPIGKVSKLTFRFEFKPGYLYDFKGINHQILMTIKFYSSPRVARPAKSLLNPDYNPDYLSYLVRVADYGDRSDEEDEDDAPIQAITTNEQARKQLLLEEKKYDYSTTDEDSDDDGNYDDDDDDEPHHEDVNDSDNEPPTMYFNHGLQLGHQSR